MYMYGLPQLEPAVPKAERDMGLSPPWKDPLETSQPTQYSCTGEPYGQRSLDSS